MLTLGAIVHGLDFILAHPYAVAKWDNQPGIFDL
jgi:hypothetical protein